MINIKGDYLEGGGQIIRTALALSTLTGKPFKVIKVRKGRSKPGLKNQHLYSLKALQELCNAEVKGDSLGSESLEYKPGELMFHNLNIDIKTAGSITLLMQALLPVVIFSDKKLTIKIKGGTDTKFSQPIDYFVNVFLPHLKKYADFEPMIEKRGYYPKGGGKFSLKITPKHSVNSYKNLEAFFKDLKEESKSINLMEQEKLILIKGVSHASKDLMKANVAERQAKTAKYLLNKLNTPTKITVQYNETLSIGSGITLWALFSNQEELDYNNPVILGSDALGERGKRAEKVGEEAASRLIKQISSRAAVDTYLVDQLLPYMALFSGKIKAAEITEHARTNIYVIKKFLDVKFKIKDNSISC